MFLAEMPGHRFNETKDMAGVSVTVSGVNNGQAIAIRTSDDEVLVIGFRCLVTVKPAAGELPLRVERGAFVGAEWKPEGTIRAETAGGEARFMLTDPQAVRVRW